MMNEGRREGGKEEGKEKGRELYKTFVSIYLLNV